LWMRKVPFRIHNGLYDIRFFSVLLYVHDYDRRKSSRLVLCHQPYIIKKNRWVINRVRISVPFSALPTMPSLLLSLDRHKRYCFSRRSAASMHLKWRKWHWDPGSGNKQFFLMFNTKFIFDLSNSFSIL